MTTGKIKIVLKIPINLRQHLSNDFKRFYPIQYFSSPTLTSSPQEIKITFIQLFYNLKNCNEEFCDFETSDRKFQIQENLKA